jgi:5-formyltetrahydrofolate cyclo-ligase
MGEHQADSKDALRRRVRAARRGLAPDVADRLGAAVCERVLRLPAFESAAHVVAYVPVENEVDPGAVVDAALAAGKRVYYPRRSKETLEFLSAGREALRPGPAGILEPTEGEPLPAGNGPVLFLVPGLAFDARGARLGRGAGCYDRALARYAAAVIVGLAYEMQLVAALPEAPWDVRMAVVVTEARVLSPKEIPA